MPEIVVAQALNDLALAYKGENKLSKAASTFRKALSGYELAYGKNSIALVSLLDNLATVHLLDKRPADAEKVARRAWVIAQSSKVDAEPITEARELLRSILAAEGKKDQADLLLK